MAEKIALDIQISTLNSAESIGALKTGIKELTKELEKLPEGSEEFRRTAAAIGNAKDKLGDLNQEVAQTTTKAGKFQAILGVGQQIANGFQLAQSAMALFGDESEAVTQALQKAQAAMQFVQGLKELEGIMDAFKNAKAVILDFGKQGVLAIRALGAAIAANPIGALLTAIVALVAVIGVLAAMEDDETESLRKNVEEREKSIDAMGRENAAANQNAKFRIDLLKAQGASEKELFEAEQQNRKTREQQLAKENQILQKQAYDLGQLRAKADDDERKELTDKINKINDQIKKNNEEKLQFERDYQIKKATLATADRKAEEERIKEQQAKAKEAAQKKAEEDKKKDEELKARIARNNQLIKEQQDEEAQAFLDKKAKEEQAIQDNLNRLRAAADAEIELNNAKLAALEKAEQEKEARQKLRVDLGLDLTKQTLQLTADIASAFAKEDEASQKRAFEINKKVQLALATIDMIKGVQSAFTSAQASPYTAVFPGYPYIQAAMAAAYGIMNIRKISQTQFEGGGGGAAGGMEGAAGGAGGAMSAPLQGGVNNTSTMLENLGQGQQEQKPIKAYVLQTDVASEDQKIKAIENKSKIE